MGGGGDRYARSGDRSEVMRGVEVDRPVRPIVSVKRRWREVWRMRSIERPTDRDREVERMRSRHWGTDGLTSVLRRWGLRSNQSD